VTRRMDIDLRTVWALLISLTLTSTVIAEGFHQADMAMSAIFVIAAAKSNLVLMHYMEARSAESQWLIMYRIWLLVVASTLVVGHLL
jgi:heme/copper-type cytochrome/quinol oxidase subunit 4